MMERLAHVVDKISLGCVRVVDIVNCCSPHRHQALHLVPRGMLAVMVEVASESVEKGHSRDRRDPVAP